MECLICFEELDEGNSIEYQAHAEGEWWPALFCADCVEQLRLTSRRSWENQVRNSSCEKEQRNLLNRGPPDRVRDVNGFPKCQDGQVYNLRKQKDKQLVACECVGEIDPDLLELISSDVATNN